MWFSILLSYLNPKHWLVQIWCQKHTGLPQCHQYWIHNAFNEPVYQVKGTVLVRKPLTAPRHAGSNRRRFICVITYMQTLIKTHKKGVLEDGALLNLRRIWCNDSLILGIDNYNCIVRNNMNRLKGSEQSNNSTACLVCWLAKALENVSFVWWGTRAALAIEMLSVFIYSTPLVRIFYETHFFFFFQIEKLNLKLCWWWNAFWFWIKILVFVKICFKIMSATIMNVLQGYALIIIGLNLIKMDGFWFKLMLLKFNLPVWEF